MDSNDLDVFSRVARAGSISRAALDSGTDQSTISRRISLLESELGVRLFRRSGRGVALTERGEMLLGYAEQMERVLGEAHRSLRDSTALGPSKLCIAAQPTIAGLMFGVLGHALKQHFPATQVRFVEGLASQLLSALREGEVDVGIVYVPEQHGTLKYDLLLTEDVSLVTPGDYPMYGDTFAVRALGEVPLILPSTHHGLRMLGEALAARHGFVPDIAYECDASISITKKMVLERCGCTVLPSAAVAEETAAGKMKRFRLVDPPVTRDVGIVWAPNPAHSEAVWEVARIIREVASALVSSGAWPDTRLAAG